MFSPPARRRPLLHLRPPRRITTSPRQSASPPRSPQQRHPQNDSLPIAFQSMRHAFQPLDLDRMTRVCDRCGAQHWIAERISGSRVRTPRWESCCKQGDVILPPYHEPPTLLRTLLTATDADARKFRQHLRQYNAAFAFTSVNCTPDRRLDHQQGVTSFNIHGELYHLQGPLETAEGRVPQYAQLFFYDPVYAAQLRSERNPELSDQLIRQLTDMLQEINPYISLYKTAAESLRIAAAADQPAQVVMTPQMQLVMQIGADRRRENLPTSEEVAVIIPDEYTQAGFRDIVLNLRDPPQGGSAFSSITSNHAAYMPLHYVLLFPAGDLGWHWALQLGDPHGIRKRTRMSQRAYYRYRLHTRSGQFSTLFYGERLFQQYVVDAWAACDQNKLDWIRSNQNHLRADVYNGLTDVILQQDGDMSATGRRVILPSSYTGGDRFMTQLFQDSMAIVRHFGKPTLFITFTANPQWTELKQELFTGQTALERPDLMARVFHLKAADLLRQLKKQQIFGRYLGCVWTIEYQKRGLPHMHLLLFLHPEDRFLDAARVDEIVSAEFPDPESDPTGELTGIVRSVMTHGPCGVHNPKAPCMSQAIGGGPATCSKRYPRAFTDETLMQQDGYPVYRRRADGRTFTRSDRTVTGQQFLFDNRWVIPYNAYLTRRYKAHINVEVCASIQAVKYIHKYIYKGSDRTTLQLQSNDDEVARYLQGRYIGPTEAVWRLFEFAVHEEFPPVIHLAIHLPDQQPVYFNSDIAVTDLQNRLDAAQSILMAFFQYNLLNTDGRQYLYQEFPVHYVYDKPRRRWHIRKRGTAIGRMYHCNPFAGERYYLRLLLTVVRGPQSFEHLRTVHGVLYPTFQAACLALGLLQDDNEWIDCFTEATRFASGSALRYLFATAMLHGGITDPLHIWMRFRDQFCDDLLRQLQQRNIIPPNLEDPQLDYGLYLLQMILTDFDKSLADFQLPDFTHSWGRTTGNSLLADEQNYDHQQESVLAAERSLQLNTDQTECFNLITAAVTDDPQHAHFFLQGSAGTGKTFLYRVLCNHYRGLGKVVLCVASSGIAALLLPGGRTSHSRFKIPLLVHESSICHINKNTQLADLLRNTALIIWDEVPMQHKYCFEAVHRTLQDLLSTDDHVFGGIPVILSGDFAQILPVIRKGNRAAIVSACLQRSFLWPQLRQLRLQQNMRLQANPVNREYAEWLIDLSYNIDLRDRICLPTFLLQLRNITEFKERVFPSAQLQQSSFNAAFFRDRVILTFRNDVVNDFNADILNRMCGELHVFDSVDSADVNEAEQGRDELPTEYLRSLSPAGLPPARLCLKVGAPIILLRNLFPKQGLCNGTRMIITQLGRRCIETRMLGGDFDGQLRLLPRIQLSTTEGELPFILLRKQFPIRLCFAMTVNKSQGQSLQHVGIDLGSSAFTHGQLYVALSRAVDLTNITVLLAENGDGKTDNVVYPEVLLNR